MKVQLVVMDLDDTLLRDDQTVSARSGSTIRRAVERGVHVAIATGRMFRSAVPYARELGLTGPILCCQGAQIADIETGRALDTRAIGRALALEVLRWAEDGGHYIQYYSTEHYYFERACAESRLYARLAGVQGVENGRPGSAALAFDPIKLLIMDEPQVISRMYAEARERWAGRMEIAISKPNYLEFTHPEANKGNAMLALARLLGVDRGAVMAVGDALNDLPMIRGAGLGVAMGNGAEAVKKEADYVTLTNEQDGVAVAIEKLALGE